MLQLESLRVRMEKVDQLRNDIEGVKTDILTNEQGVNELQEQAVANEKASRQLQEDVTRLNTSVEKLLDATAQVCISVHAFLLSRCFNLWQLHDTPYLIHKLDT